MQNPRCGHQVHSVGPCRRTCYLQPSAQNTVEKPPFGGLLKPSLCIIAHVVHRQRRIRLFYVNVLLAPPPPYRYRVSALFTKQYRQIFLMFSSVVLNLVLVNSIQETVPSPNTAGNRNENSLALASLSSQVPFCLYWFSLCYINDPLCFSLVKALLFSQTLVAH